MIDREDHVTQRMSVDMAELHRAMDHVARTLWDIQKTRVQVGNRVAAMKDEAELGGPQLDRQTSNLAELNKSLKREEDRLNRELERLGAQHPLAPWINGTRGLGLPGLARLMGLTGPLDRFANPAKLWKFVGLGLVDGRTQKRRKGEPWTHTDCTRPHMSRCKPGCQTDHHPNCGPGVEGTAYSPQGRVVCFQIVDAVVKTSGPYRLVYDEAKAKYLAKERVGASGCPTGLHHRSESGKTLPCPQAHIDTLAKRYVAKRIVRDIWVEWQGVRPMTSRDAQN